MPGRIPFLSNDALRVLVVAYRRRRRRHAAELSAALAALAVGVWERFQFTDDRDDFVQDLVTHLLGRPLARCDVGRSPFAFLYTCAVRYGAKLREKERARRRRWLAYAAGAVESGRELPRVEARDG